MEFYKVDNNEYYKQLVKRWEKDGMYICTNSCYYSYDSFLYAISPEDYEKYQKWKKLVYEKAPYFELDETNPITGNKKLISLLDSECRDNYFTLDK